MDKLPVKSLLSITLIDRYLIQELYKTFLGVTVVLVLIIFANNFVVALDKIVRGHYGSDALLQVMFFELMQTVNFIFPPALFFAILLSLGRLYRDSEIIAMQASGVGPVTLYKSYLLGAIPVIILSLLMVLYTLPWANASKAQLKASQDTENTTFAAIEVGKFQELQSGETVFFAASEDDKPGGLRDVFIQNRRNGELGIISAQEAYQLIDRENGQHYMVLKNGYRYTGEPGQNTYTASSFYEYGIRIRQLEQRQAKLPVKALPTAELWQSDDPKHRMEMQFRYSIPLAMLALTFLAIPLSRSMPRQGIYGRMLVAFVVYFAFMNVHKVAEKWMEDGDSPLWLGMWWVPIVAIGIALLIETRDRYAYLLMPGAVIKRFKKA